MRLAAGGRVLLAWAGDASIMLSATITGRPSSRTSRASSAAAPAKNPGTPNVAAPPTLRGSVFTSGLRAAVFQPHVSRDDCLTHAEFRDKHGLSIGLLLRRLRRVRRRGPPPRTR